MRDYAELGRQRVRGLRTAQHHDEGHALEGGLLARAWGVLSSGGVSLGLGVVLVIGLLMETSGGIEGAGLWGVGIGPMMVRLVLILLTANLVAVGVERVGRWRAGEVAGGLEVARVTATDKTPWKEVLAQGGAQSIQGSGSRWWGHRGGLVVGGGVVLLHAAGLVLLWQHALSVDAPPLAEVTLVEGQPVEAWSLAGTEAGQGLSSRLVSREPLKVFSGYQVDIEQAEQLRPFLGDEQSLPPGEGAALVMKRAGEPGDGQRFDFDSRGRVTLSDGTVFRVKRVRNDLRPASATFGIRKTDGEMFVRRVSRGHTLTWPGGPGLSVAELEVDRLGQGGAVKFLEMGTGRGFWMFKQAPELAAESLPAGVSIDLLELHNGLVVTLELIPPQGGFLPALGVTLLLLGGALLLAKPSTTVALRAEGDRLVLEGQTLNDAAGLPDRLHALATFCATTQEQTGKTHVD